MNYRLISWVMFFILTFGALTASADMPASATEENNSFQFMISQYHTTRQNGQTVNIYVRFAYNKDLPVADYVDYRLMRTRVLSYMEPTAEYPEGVFWEVLATQIGRTLMHEFPLQGVSVQLNVMDNTDPNRYEPGNHGPIFSTGNINPLAVSP